MTPDKLFKQKQQLMPNEELANLVQEEVSKLCKTGGHSLHMSVPPQVKDTDMLICELIDRFQKISEELKVTDHLLNERQRVLDAIPECPEHGLNCVPHAVEWVKSKLEN